MKTDELQKHGLTQEQIDFVMSENGKDLKKLQKENSDLTADRDGWRAKAETAEDALKGFDGIDPNQVQAELERWKKKAEDAETEFRQKLYDRDFADALKAQMEEYRFTSEAAKAAIMTEVKDAGLTLKDGKILGLGDLIDQIKGRDASAFVDESQEALEETRARFTQPMRQKKNGQFGRTKDEIMAIKDRSERRAAIAQNMHLFEGD